MTDSTGEAAPRRETAGAGPANGQESLQSCFAYVRNGELTLGNDVWVRRYRITPETLIPASLVFGGCEWLAGDNNDNDNAGGGAATTAAAVFRTFSKPLLGAGVPALIAELTWGAPENPTRRTFAIVPGLAAVTASVERTGLRETGKAPAGAAEDKLVVCEAWRPAPFHLRLREYRFADQTDFHDNLLRWLDHRLSPIEPLRLRGGLFVLEDPLERAGLILLKLAPLPERRTVPDPVDLAWDGSTLALTGDGYPWAVLAYEGGENGAIAALHRYQLALRPLRPGRDGLAMSNTWGDRNRDGNLGEAFLLEEIDRAADLGVDVCQIDDGWQAGATPASVDALAFGGGRYAGYHAAAGDFWAVHPRRFPRGLAPLARRAAERGVGLGLWFSPDSDDDFARWEKDAEIVLRLEREYGARWIKIDGVAFRTPQGEANLARFFQTVAERSDGRVVFDLDVTAEIRPGYFGLPNHGPLFVENRYTDIRRYWPCATFRNAWLLSHAVLPARLRMEVPNPERNAGLYGDDPLAPVHYGMDWLFASVMAASPLLWCELSKLSAKSAEALRRIMTLWRRHRDELHGGAVYPVGPCPDGGTTSGFFTDAPRARHLILLRDLDPEATREWTLPLPVDGWRLETVAGTGECRPLDARRASCTLPRTRSWLWLRFGRD